MDETEQKAFHLEQQLKEKGAKCRELTSLRKKLEELQTVTQGQEQSLAQSQAELTSLETILALLHLREVNKQTLTLCVQFCYVFQNV